MKGPVGRRASLRTVVARGRWWVAILVSFKARTWILRGGAVELLICSVQGR